jgi:predicted ATPase
MLSEPSTYKQNLPAAVSSFIGREQELREIGQRLREHRLVTLTGMGGTGKTRLALQAAAGELGHFADGVWLVEFAGLSAPELVAQTIAKVLALPEAPDLAPIEQLGAFLQSRRLLLVLDNCEHLIEECARITALHLGNVRRAFALFSESLVAHQAQQNRLGMAECLIGFAAIAVVRGSPAVGARLLATADAIGGPRVKSSWAVTRREYVHALALARAKLTEAELEAEQAAGRALSLEQAIQYAQNLPLPSRATPANREIPDDLTEREREVAALIARGKSNGEIASELVVSKRTVEKHIANLLSKLALASRAQIVRWAFEHGLSPASE